MDATLSTLISLYRETHQRMREVVTGLNSDALQYTPAPETNSIAVLVVHTLGSEAEALRIVAASFADTPPDVLALSWDALLPTISPDGTFTQDGVRQYLQIMVTMGQLDSLPPLDEGVLWTNRFLQ